MILFHPDCHRVNAALVTRTILEQLVTTVAPTARTDNQPISPKLPAPNTFHSQSSISGENSYFRAIYSYDDAGPSRELALGSPCRQFNSPLDNSIPGGRDSGNTAVFGVVKCESGVRHKVSRVLAKTEVLFALSCQPRRTGSFQVSFLELPDDVTTTVELSVLFVETTIRHGSYRAIWATFIC